MPLSLTAGFRRSMRLCRRKSRANQQSCYARCPGSCCSTFAAPYEEVVRYQRHPGDRNRLIVLVGKLWLLSDETSTACNGEEEMVSLCPINGDLLLLIVTSSGWGQQKQLWKQHSGMISCNFSPLLILNSDVCIIFTWDNFLKKKETTKRQNLQKKPYGCEFWLNIHFIREMVQVGLMHKSNEKHLYFTRKT